MINFPGKATGDLRKLRNAAPAEDRDSEALTPLTVGITVRAGHHPSLTVPIRRAAETPITVEQLVEWCGIYGVAAAEHAKWGAVQGWVLRTAGLHGGPEAARELSSVLGIYAHAATEALGFPSLNGEPHAPKFPTLASHQRHTITAKAAEALRQWEAAGMPRFVESIGYTHQLVGWCVKNAIKRGEDAAINSVTSEADK